MRDRYNASENVWVRLVPEANRNDFRCQRLLTAILLAVDESDLAVESLCGDARDLVQGHAQGKTRLRAGLIYKLATQPLLVQQRRIELLEQVLGKDAISAILPLTRHDGKPKENAARVLERLARTYSLPPPPGVEAEYAAWTKWAEAARVGK
jgi:hypothetical protein